MPTQNIIIMATVYSPPATKPYKPWNNALFDFMKNPLKLNGHLLNALHGQQTRKTRPRIVLCYNSALVNCKRKSNEAAPLG